MGAPTIAAHEGGGEGGVNAAVKEGVAGEGCNGEVWLA